MRTHDPSVQEGEDISSLRPSDHCDRLWRKRPWLIRRTIPKFAWGKLRNISVRIASVLVENRTRHPPNTTLKSLPLRQPARSFNFFQCCSICVSYSTSRGTRDSLSCFISVKSTEIFRPVLSVKIEAEPIFRPWEHFPLPRYVCSRSELVLVTNRNRRWEQ
jgi:hypothetical protein